MSDRPPDQGIPPTPPPLSATERSGPPHGGDAGWRRAVLVGVIVGVAAIAAGIAVGIWVLPSSDELQRAAIEEVGIDPALLEHPLVEPLVGRMTERVQARLVDETRGALILGVITSALAGVIGTVLAARYASRRATPPS